MPLVNVVSYCLSSPTAVAYGRVWLFPVEFSCLSISKSWKIILRVVVPLSGPIVAVLSLFYAVGHWNRYFDALIFLKSPGLFNIQLVLRNIMMAANAILEQTMDLGNAMRAAEIVEVFKYAVIVFSALSVLLMYPFIQRYFIKAL